MISAHIERSAIQCWRQRTIPLLIFCPKTTPAGSGELPEGIVRGVVVHPIESFSVAYRYGNFLARFSTLNAVYFLGSLNFVTSIFRKHVRIHKLSYSTMSKLNETLFRDSIA